MTDIAISIDPVFPLWTIVTVGILVFVLLIWKESKSNINFLAYRIAAVVIMMLSIVGLLLQPSVKREVRSQGVVLLTQHYKTEIADSLRNANSKLTFLRTPEADHFPGAKQIATLGELSEYNIRFVIGDGLPYYALGETNGYQYSKGELLTGIVQLVTPPIFKINQQNSISGLFRSRGNSSIKLISPVGVEDSISFDTDGDHPFKLLLTPTQTGLFVYNIEVQEGKEKRSHKFPVEVAPIELLSILFIQSYPTAEINYLKNFLKEQGHKIVSRSQLSKSNFHYEYTNHEKIVANRLESNLLNSFDLFVIDSEALESLAKSEKENLEEAVKNGLGVIQLFNSIPKKSRSGFFSIQTMNLATDTVRLKLKDNAFTFSALPVSINGTITSTLQLNQRILAGFSDKGSGKIGFQFLQETYRLILIGKQFEYALLWSPLIELTARFKNQTSKIHLTNDFPIYTDEPVYFNVISPTNDIGVQADKVPVPLREDVVIDNYLHGTVWAGKSGWHEFAIKGDSIIRNYYVSDEKEWESLRITQQQRANELVSKGNASTESSSKILTEQKPIQLLYFYIAFLMSAGFLWLAPKM